MKKRIVKENRVVWQDVVIAFLFGIIIVAGILCIARTIWSGYHFLDDHELIRIEQGAAQKIPLLDQMSGCIKNDLNQRYRPIYWVERVAGGYLMGSNLTAWNIWTAIKGVLAFALLYLGARYVKADRLISLVFPMVVMLGTQFTPWYRSANQESTGLLLCAAVLCLLAAQYAHKKYTSVAYNIPIVILVILSGLEKESFTLFMLVFPMLKLWLEYWDGCDASWVGTRRKGRLIRMLRENAAVYLCILVAFLINVYMILFRVGVDRLSYAGFHSDTGLNQYLHGISDSLLENHEVEYFDSGTIDIDDAFMLPVGRKAQYMEIFKFMCHFTLRYGNTVGSACKERNVGKVFVPVYHCLWTVVCFVGIPYFQKG